MENMEFEKASHHLAGLDLSSRNDIEPGETLPLSEDVKQFEFGEAKQVVTMNNDFPVMDESTYDDVFDEDDFLENISEDQLHHYQSNNKPEFSMFLPMTLGMKKFETNLPPGLSTMCSHNCKLGLCPEASFHLLKMKHRIMAISDDLIYKFGELDKTEEEELRKEWQQNKKQIQELENFLALASPMAPKLNYSETELFDMISMFLD